MVTRSALFVLLLLFLFQANSQTSTYKVGVAKTDITIFKKGAGMLGYSMSFNVSEGIATRLYARSFVIEDGLKHKVAIVECELAFVPSELKQAVVAILQKNPATRDFTEENFILMAQHTHSGPAGFCHYAAYNMSVPGFIPEIFDHLSTKIAASITEANAVLTPCQIKLNKGFFPDDWEVAFNRSLAAYNRNPDVEKQTFENRHKAVNREMTLMQFIGEHNVPIGSINWFGVHATSLSNDNKLINADNKGYAALFLEDYYKSQNSNYVGAFAQGTAGDVTPKFVYNPKRHWQRGYWDGKFTDDVESAKYNGELQYRKAKEIIENTNQKEVKQGMIHCVMRYYDFSKIKVDTAYSHTADVKTTGPSCIGMTMLGGALMDGPAASPIVVTVGKFWIKMIRKVELARTHLIYDEKSERIKRKYRVQGVKPVALETGEKRLLGTADIKNHVLPAFADPTIAAFKHFHRKGALKEHTWSPQILPIQLVQIGDVVLVALPFEITTTAGRRLKKGLEDLYAKSGENVQELILCPYANSYSGYMTTYEEYQEQLYEGGHTVFGENSLAALQTVFKDLFRTRHIPFHLDDKKIVPPVFSKKELGKRSF